MTSSLLSISIGPVQEFIAAARKTADLYAGSQLLQDVVAAAAGTFTETERIFPADVKGGGANKILAVVDADPKQRAAQAEAAARACLLKLWETYSAELKEDIDRQRAEAQLDSFLEVYAAWVPTTDATYADDRNKVEALLAGRKALRDFATLDQHDAGIPKSPLDPAYASVLRLEGLQVSAQVRTRLNLKPSETLDAVSLLKRRYGRTLEYVPSTHDLAHAGASDEARVASRFRPSREAGDDETNLPAYPYFAILVADGDNMGRLLDGKNRAEHKQVSESLDAFAAEAKTIVAGLGGFCIYAGGDDVLALLTVTTALACGQQLSAAFRHAVRGTLSAGIAIVHYREPLSASLARARAAEKAAKAIDGKDAVSVALHTRGGVPMNVALKWDRSGGLQDWQAKAGSGSLPRGLSYELRELAREWPTDFAPALLTAEARRVVKRKVQQDGQKLSDKEVETTIPDLKTVKQLAELAELLVLARFLSGRGDRA